MQTPPQTAFEVPIWGFILNEHQHQAVDYFNDIIRQSESMQSMVKSNFGGWQSHEDLHLEPLYKELFSTIANLCNTISTNYLGTPKQGKIESAWANVNYQHCFNGHHVHSGDLSGVFYLSVPEDSGKLVFVNPAVRSQSRSFSTSNYGLDPQDLALIVFPSWLEHYVEPSRSTSRRVSVSFNYEFTN